jgi:hypothetical protein
MAKLRTFTRTYQNFAAPAPLGVANVIFDLFNFNRRFKLNSVLFDIRIWEMVTTEPFPLEQNITQEFWLMLSALPLGDNMAQHFELPIVGAGVITNNGNAFQIYRPGQYFFDSLYIQNALRFSFLYNNRDILLAYGYDLQVCANIEDIETT